MDDCDKRPEREGVVQKGGDAIVDVLDVILFFPFVKTFLRVAAGCVCIAPTTKKKATCQRKKMSRSFSLARPDFERRRAAYHDLFFSSGASPAFFYKKKERGWRLLSTLPYRLFLPVALSVRWKKTLGGEKKKECIIKKPKRGGWQCTISLFFCFYFVYAFAERGKKVGRPNVAAALPPCAAHTRQTTKKKQPKKSKKNPINGYGRSLGEMTRRRHARDKGRRPTSPQCRQCRHDVVRDAAVFP